MTALLLFTQGAQGRLPCLLLVTHAGSLPRKCVHTERRASGDKWTAITCRPEGAFISREGVTILSGRLTRKDICLESMCSIENLKYHGLSRTSCWAQGIFFSASPTPRLNSLPSARVLISGGLRLWTRAFWKHRRGVPQNSYYCFVRHASDSVKARVAEENRRIRERFEAREKEWEKLVDERLLHPEDVRIHEAHKLAVARGHFTYDDPYTGYRVMTRLRHFLRGSCCGNACRHCVYDHENVAERERSQRVFNSSFWVDSSSRPDLRGAAPRPLRPSQGNSAAAAPGTDDEKETTQHEISDPLIFKH